MNIFEMVKALYEEKGTAWIDSITPEDLIASHPIIITKFLSMNKNLTWQLPILNEYAVVLDTKKFLFIAWALVPKGLAPYCKYIKPGEEDEFTFVWDKVKHYTEIRGNDFKSAKKYLLKDFKANMKTWFFALGIEKKYWKKYDLDYKSEKKVIAPIGLGAWF